LYCMLRFLAGSSGGRSENAVSVERARIGEETGWAEEKAGLGGHLFGRGRAIGEFVKWGPFRDIKATRSLPQRVKRGFSKHIITSTQSQAHDDLAMIWEIPVNKNKHSFPWWCDLPSLKIVDMRHFGMPAFEQSKKILKSSREPRAW